MVLFKVDGGEGVEVDGEGVVSIRPQRPQSP